MKFDRFLLLGTLLTFGQPLRAAESDEQGNEYFEKKVRPILVEHCYSCHSAAAPKLKGGLRLDSRQATLAGGESGIVLVPGHPEKSKFIEAITYKNVDLQMPKSGKLPEAVIADLTAWIKMGAPWPGKEDKETSSTPAAGKAAFDLEKRKQEHWAWKPVRAPALPAVKDAKWPLAAADRFILGPLEAKGIAPAPPAEARTLLRRISFDLTGLPPAPEEIEAFEKAHRADPQAALAAVVDKLLASPRFGERWGRHWLDLVRYGESRGHEFDYNIPNAWQYRDYVIRALNADVPYHQFVTEHLAGDLMPSPRLSRDGSSPFNESILGTGFWFLGEEVHSPVDIRGDEADRFDNRIDVFSKTFLGLTVSCARCHDHKFDAITTKDYYALYGFLRSSNYRLVRFDSLEQNRKIARDLARLRSDARPVILRAYADAFNPSVNRAADYLLAAHQLNRAASGGAISARIDKVAAERKLDSGRLAHWTLHLQRAVKEPADPLHAWAMTADNEKARLTQLDALRRDVAAAKLSRSNAEIAFDYADARPQDWMPDDVSFGPGPVKPGDIRFSNDPAKPVAKIFDYAAAEKDPTFHGLKVTGGAQFDSAALGYNRAGYTIRTPTFPIKSGKIYYRVKGAGKVYASVDAHVTIAGPLHGALVRSFKSGDAFQWQMHDLSAYKGHHVHLEFTAESPDFAVATVVQGNAPPNLIEPPAPWLIRALEAEELPAAATIYQEQFAKITGLLAKDSVREPDDARLAGWMIRHPELFGVDEKQIAESSRPFMEAQAKLVAGIKTESRLALAMQDGSPADEHVFIRGSHKAAGDLVNRRLLEALAGPNGIDAKTGSGRLELARQMTDPAVNPFISRVAVNRVWHHLFGRGLVASTDNFGVLGERPTHPELLDHLALQFVNDGWSLKKLIRTLVLSRSYQMSSRPDPVSDAADPENHLLHRARLRRLQGEAIRDTMLAVSGRLDTAMYGPSVPVWLTPFLEGRGRPASGPLDGAGRRSIYLAVRRNFLSPMLLTFDTPSPFSTVGRRTVSNVPAQALILMNDPFVHLMAEQWGKKLAAAPGSPQEKITSMYLSAFGRRPSEADASDCLAYLQSRTVAATNGADDAKRWKELAHVLFNVKEFIFLE